MTPPTPPTPPVCTADVEMDEPYLCVFCHPVLQSTGSPVKQPIWWEVLTNHTHTHTHARVFVHRHTQWLQRLQTLQKKKRPHLFFPSLLKLEHDADQPPPPLTRTPSQRHFIVTRWCWLKADEAGLVRISSLQPYNLFPTV